MGTIPVPVLALKLAGIAVEQAFAADAEVVALVFVFAAVAVVGGSAAVVVAGEMVCS